MNTQIKKWGNSLALRIPKALATQLHLEPGTPVQMTAEHGALVIRPVRNPRRKRKYTLQELLAGVTEENRHPEIDWGPPVGKEIW